MKKNIFSVSVFTIVFAFSSLFFTACEKKQAKNSHSIVAVSSFVLYDVVSHIAQDTVEIINLIPVGVDIHSYEPTPKIMSKLEKSDIVFYSGAVLEPWLTSSYLKNRAVALSDFIRLRDLQNNTQVDEHDHSGGSCSHSSHSNVDPHFWFDIQNMKKITDIVTYELISLKPNNKELYLNNRDKYIEALENLDYSYKNTLKECKLDTIITDHNAFSYLSHNYNFKIKTLSGFSPDAEVSPKDIIRVMDDVKLYNVSVVFFENFTSDKSMKSVAEQTGVRIESLHPLGNITKEDAQKNSDYEDIMRENLEKIVKALECP